MRKSLMIITLIVMCFSSNVYSQDGIYLPFSDSDVNLQQAWTYELSMGGGQHRAFDFIDGPIDNSGPAPDHPNWISFRVCASYGGSITYIPENAPNGSSSWGNYIAHYFTLDDSDYKMVYAHLESSPHPINVSVDASAGMFLGMSGKSGAANSVNHLHWETYKKIDNVWTRIDPYGIASSVNDVIYRASYYPNATPGIGSNNIFASGIPSCVSSPVGYFADYVWDDNVSQAFLDKYNGLISGGHPLGNAWDNGPYDEFVHLQNHMYIQDFQDTRDEPDGVSNGYEHPYTALIRDENADSWDFPVVLKDGFWDVWTTKKRWLILGSVMGNEYNQGSYHLQDFRHYGINYPDNPNDYKDYHLRYDTITEIIVPLDENDQPTTFANLKVEQDNPALAIMLETDENDYSVENIEKLKGALNNNEVSGSGSLSKENPFKDLGFFTASTKSLTDGVYHSGVKIMDFGESFELVDGDSYKDFYAIVDGLVVLINSFTMNGNLVIYVDDSPLAGEIQFGYWNVSPNPGDIGQQLHVEGEIYNVSFAPITLSEIRVELIDPSGNEAYHYSEYNVTLETGDGWYQWMDCYPYMPGNHTARFRGLINGQWTTFSTYTVYIEGTSLISEFTADIRLGDIPLTVNFTEQTAGNPTWWAWDFGDGTFSIDQNPSHTYNMAGIYTVKMESGDGYATDRETKYSYITVTDVLQANLISNVTNGSIPLNVQFTDQSLGSPTSWLWNFGDGNISSEQNPMYTYTSAGIYNVMLTVSDQSGSETITKTGYIVAGDLQSNFSASSISIGAGEQISFTDLSIGDPTSWTWDFGDGDIFTHEGGMNHTYMDPGTYTVSLTVSNDLGTDVETKVDYITVGESMLSFTADVVSGRVPLTVNFAGSAPVTSDTWCWDFGDGSVSLITPGIPCTQFISYTYEEAGVYDVGLATDDNGESIYVIYENFITVSGSFTADVTEGFSPLTVNFSDESGFSASTWSWNFGDGNTSTLQNPTHIYSDAGLYTVTFVAGTGPEALTMVREDYIYVVDSAMGFEADPTYGSAPLTVQFDNQSLGSPIFWGWDFGDGVTSIDKHPIHTYSNIGVYSVMLLAMYGSHTDTLIHEDYITVSNEVLASSFTLDIGSGVAPLVVQFTDQSTGGPSFWDWNFGDGNTSAAQNPSHTYESIGTYTVSLTVGSGGASDLSSQNDFVVVYPAVNARFTSDVTQGLIALEVQFTDQSLGSPTSWLWNFGDGNTSTDQNPTHTYSSVGTYDVSLTANNAIDSHSVVKSGYIIVSVLNADYNSDVTSGIAPLAVQFTDESLGNPTSWLWNFGDGNISTDQNPTHTYFALGAYDVSLTVSSSAGSNSLNQEDYIIVVDGLYADFSTNVSSGVTPLLVQFYDRSLGDPTSWLWNFGDGNVSTEQSPFYTYTVSGTYDVSLLVVAGADSSSTITEACVVVSDILSTNFSASDTTGTIPLTVQFTDQSPGSPTSWLWNFGDGNTSTEQNPSHTYTSVDTFTVSLLISDDAGANSLVREDYITTVVAVVADFSADDSNVYIGVIIQFTDASTGDPTSWFWNFGNGDTSTEQNPIYAYNTVGTYDVSLTVSNGVSDNTLLRTDYITVEEDISGVGDTANVFALHDNHPNPFNPQTTVSYSLPSTQRVRLSIYDVTGRMIVTLVDGVLEQGSYTALWNGRNTQGQVVSSGVYFYQLTTAENTETRKMLLVK